MAKSATTELNDTVQLLFPDGYSIRDQFPVLQDTHVKEAPHQQIENMKDVSQLQKEVYDDLRSRSGDNYLFGNTDELEQAMNTYLEQDQYILTRIAAIFSLSSGPCPRAWQLGGLQFGSSDENDRNLWILKDGRLILGNFPSKQRHRKIANVFFPFPHDASKYLAAYFYILRPVLLKILTDDLQADVTPTYSNVIWAFPIPNEKSADPLQWKGPEISTAVRDCTKKSLAPLLIRQVSHAVLRDKFPQLFQTCFSKDKAETISEELHLYGSKVGFPPQLNLQSDEAVKLLAVAEIWQATFGLGQFKKAWQSMVSDAHVFPTTKHTQFAEGCVKIEVYKNYLAPSADRAAALDFDDFPPFLAGAREGDRDRDDDIGFGDQTLVTVTAAVIFGPDTPRIDSTPPLFGICVKDVVTAARLVMFCFLCLTFKGG